MRLLPAVSCLLLLARPADAVRPAGVVGLWSADCRSGAPVLQIATPRRAVMTVNENQILVAVALAPVAPGQYDLRYVAPHDLGHGGDGMDWAHYSRATPIARLRLTSPTAALLTWQGFTDAAGRRRWLHGPDFRPQPSSPATVAIEWCAP